uniref:Ribosomal protein S2 n=1 Tax=Rhizaria sp. TaxID=2204297 RepID=A0A5P8DJU2_9EUKA|nr:ribosomal protein S2 [Rhizaria sp.]
MSIYYKKLINRNILLKFWIFSGNELKNLFPINYKFVSYFYRKKVLLEMNTFISIFKKILPVLNSVINNKAKFLFVGSNYIYSQTVYNTKSNFIGQLIDWNVGIFTNFSWRGFQSFNYLKLNSNPSLIFFLFIPENNFLVLEAKKKKIPTIGLVASGFNSILMDYPIFLNSTYFYNIYIFSKFFFRYIISNII